MSFRRRKASSFGDADASPDVPQEQGSTTAESSTYVAKRIETYVTGHEDAAAEGPTDVQAEHRAEEEPTAAEPEMVANVATVGEEVDAVLKSAHEAAARIRQAADEEAKRVRAEALSAATTEVAAARRIAEDERAEAARLRTEAKTYFEDARAAADAFAAQRRSEAAREAAQMVAEAKRGGEAAAAEAERELREATVTEREHLESLRAEIERHEKRLDSILAVSRGTTAELENLLEPKRGEADDDAAVSDEVAESAHEFETALRPGSPGSRAG